MKNHRTFVTAVLIALAMAAGAAAQQFPMMDKITDHIIQKYQSSTCDQLWQDKLAAQGQPKSPEEQRVISMLKSDPQMRAAFIGKIAVPVADKLFECGMIP